MTISTKRLGNRVNELLVLAVLRDEPMHGYQIALEVEDRSDGAFELQHGTLYPLLHGLEDEGLIAGKWSEEGRRRKVYRLTRAGRRHLGAESSRLLDALGQLRSLLSAEGHGDVRPRPASG